jgi:hypothetical protein
MAWAGRLKADLSIELLQLVSGNRAQPVFVEQPIDAIASAAVR